MTFSPDLAPMQPLAQHGTSRAMDNAEIVSGRRRFWQRFVQQRFALLAASYIALLLFLAIFGPWIAPHDPYDQNLRAALQGPDQTYWLGTDHLGRDILSQLIFGARISILAGVQGVGIAIILGIPLGLIAGYRGGWLDRGTMWLVDMIFALPPILLALCILAILGPGLTNAMIAIGIGYATRYVRLTRGVVMAEREELYVESAKAIGARTFAILQHHLLPNILPPLIIQTTQLLGAVLLAEASLSFLGLGVQLNEPSWGRMLADTGGYMARQPFLPFPPGIALTVTVLAFNILGDGLNDALGRDIKSRIAKLPLRQRKRFWMRRPSVYPDSIPASAVEGHDTQNHELCTATPILAIRGLEIKFPAGNGSVWPVVQDLSFTIAAGETVGLVGESGSGKSMTAAAVMGLIPPPGAITAGSILLNGEEVSELSEVRLRQLRGKEIGMIFQEPVAALNPALTIGQQIAEPLRIHLGFNKQQARNRALELLEMVGIPDARRLDDYPHQFSGGMAQRVMIARALACRPQILIADEPTTALDVTVQAQVLDVLVQLQSELGMALLLITHDLGVVARMCQRVAVMYAGQIVEIATVEELFRQPQHPYTAALLTAIPNQQSSSTRLTSIPGQPPNPDAWSVGCRFADRCPNVMEHCQESAPLLQPVQDGHWSRCFLTQ